MKYIYFWNREMTDRAPALFDSAQEYLDAVRYRPLDTSFSYITSRADNAAFFDDSQYVGLGFVDKLFGRDYRAIEVYAGSPAAEAGIERGARFLEIGGRSVESWLQTGELGNAFGPRQAGVTVQVRFQDTQGSVRSATMTKRAVTIPTVSATRVFDVDGRRVGYVYFRNFVRPSTQALSDAFATLRAAGVSELVLDLRYNGGGLVDVAEHLGDLIGGARTAGQVFAEYFHNDLNAHRNVVLRFADKPQALDLRRLVVITTQNSASASELIINALRPFLPVTIVGGRTYGKPVGQYGLDFCDKTFAVVAFHLRNARREGDFFNGFAPDCPAPDDIEHQFGDPAEGSLQEALFFLRNGRCSAAARSAETARALSVAERSEPRRTGWDVLLNAR